MRRLAVPLAALLLAVPAGEAAEPVATIAASDHRISAFAASGGTLAWIEDGPCVRLVFSRRGRQSGFCVPGAGSLALAGGRAAWPSVYGGNRTTTDLYVARRRAPRAPVDSFVEEHSGFGEGRYLSAPVGAGSTLAYGWYEVKVEPTEACERFLRCRTRIGGGAVRVIGGRRVSRAPAALLAVNGAGSAAYVRVTKSWHEFHGERPRALRTRLEAIDLRTGRVRMRATAPGQVRALALGRRVLLVLSGSALRRYDLRTGRLLGITRAARVSSTIAASGDRAVLLRGRSLLALDLRTGRLRVLARTGGSPIGLALAGGRALWAENAGHHAHAQGRIRAVALPRG